LYTEKYKTLLKGKQKPKKMEKYAVLTNPRLSGRHF
jgi:hypothetical protein